MVTIESTTVEAADSCPDQDIINDNDHRRNLHGISSDHDNIHAIVEEELEDAFDVNAVPMPRLSSSTVPIVVQVSNAHRTARFYQNDADPLFQGICLYSTTTSAISSSNTASADATTRATEATITPTEENPSSQSHRWYVPSLIRSLWWRRNPEGYQIDQDPLHVAMRL